MIGYLPDIPVMGDITFWPSSWIYAFAQWWNPL